ncbi:oxidoreductase [Aeromonas salmonicida]|uniref:Putative acrylyl-CoA reductase AcuI n=1 Tax=Aeromonas salmonicida subsp. pectinolytica 34mel TaxID=1324960 RepID=T0P7G1_AERSA|nr:MULTISPECIES: MDR family oxidoreductase [Aeromonas]MBP6140760.1 oxidoreductase [Aeromonas sp.]ATP07355.1 putative acrylyl-CoA reductase AcuI [Aeromonas salmonicida subsp. pectinolytica 34mel]EQC02910.1 quinone oxidoreductase YhdH/YhfP family protein [Aeromonas salmonicida subsp. pectinolytica 34mel]TNI10282.1 oxidoreductase [Aeromonas salmonicida]UUI60940.1 oxidoreductase [Aeromonas salmonicida]
MFKALLLENQDGKTAATLTRLAESQLPAGEVRVAVSYSSLNYKDGLAITGKGKIVRQWPLVPGIDFAGTVLESADSRYQVGDKVVLTGWGVGEGHWGGMAEQARVKADWLVPLPAGLDERQAMCIGTAGLTAMLCVLALEEAGITPDSGEVLVTGAAGGVGSTSVALLAALGYQVAALTGRPEEQGAMLTALGASRIVPRGELLEPAKPLEKQLWAGAVDTVGSQVLAKLLAQMNYGGAVAACGLAGGFDLKATVMPFILRNVRLQGIDSVMCPLARRQLAWQRLARDLPARFFEQAVTEIALEQVVAAAEAITQGRIAGRTLVKL